MPRPHKISSAGVALVAAFEGVRLSAYRDAVGVWTIGYGHTAGVRSGQRLSSVAAARALLDKDLDIYEKAVNAAVKRTITQPMFDALVSFAFNVGVGALRGSTLLRYVNAGKNYAAARQFMRWNRGGGRVLLGLTRRRRAEQARFLRGASNRAVGWQRELDQLRNRVAARPGHRWAPRERARAEALKSALRRL